MSLALFILDAWHGIGAVESTFLAFPEKEKEESHSKFIFASFSLNPYDALPR